MSLELLPARSGLSSEMTPMQLRQPAATKIFDGRKRSEAGECANRQSSGGRSYTPIHRIDSTVAITPASSVKRRTASWPGMSAEIVQAAQHDKIESRFCAPVHFLAVYDRGARLEGGTNIARPHNSTLHSTLRDFRRKLVFVPANHEYYDWQRPRVLSRAIYFYFDPIALMVNMDPHFANIVFSPQLFVEDSRVWDTAIKLKSLIEDVGSDHRLYIEALGMVLAHELVRLNSGTPRVEPVVRGGLAAWQERIVVSYIEEHFAEPISLATLAQLVRLSPYYFCRAFKQSFGVPPHRYHMARRVEHAKTLLAKPAPSVTDIGFALGFSQTSSFTAAFRKATGLTPTAYHRSFG
jgi:AraC family transcriptional regulator